jgi:hypothetical protein
MRTVETVVKEYDPNEPRDWHGRWTSGGASGGSTSAMAEPRFGVKRVGRRSYIIGNTYTVRDHLKSEGARWDPDERAWWVGDHDKAVRLAETLNSNATSSGGGEKSGPGKNATVAGRATYKGRSYYLAGRAWSEGPGYYRREHVNPVYTRDNEKILLIARDGSFQFWAPRDMVQVDHRYERPKTIVGLERFAEGVQSGRIPTCGFCGRASCDGARGGLCEED